MNPYKVSIPPEFAPLSFTLGYWVKKKKKYSKQYPSSYQNAPFFKMKSLKTTKSWQHFNLKLSVF